MKNAKKLLLLSLTAATALYASGDDEILKRLEALEKEVSSLKKENIQLKDTITKSNKEEMSDELGALEDRLDGIETMALLDKINLGLGFQTRMENYEKTLADGSKFSDNNIWSTKLNLNMSANITDTLNFNGRLTMFKYWADSDPNLLSSRDSMQGRRPNDSTLYVERAYVDWTVLNGEIPIIVTLGRQPSSDGPSHNFKDNTVRKSTYSALAFDGAADGVVLTTNFSKKTGMENNALRIAYGKAYQAHDNTYPTYSFTGTQIESMSNAELEDTNIIGVFLDGAIPGVNNSLVQFGYVNISNLVYTDMTNAQNSNENLGDFELYGLMAEVTNLMGSGLDLFAHYGISKASPNGKFVGMVGLLSVDMNGDGVADMIEKDGSAYWLGMRYALPSNFGKIGYEFNHGSKGWFNLTVGSNDMVNKLATRGNAHEVYYIYDINRYAYLKAGYQMIDYDYTGSGDFRGAPMSINDALAAGYTNTVDKLSNLYFSFNILY